MQQPLYLMWARETAAWLGANPDAYDLFSSAIQTPHALMERHIEAHGALDLLTGGGKLSASWGHPAFTGALARIYGVDDPARILVTAGASNAYLLVVRALVAPGDHVILETPVYEPFVTVPTDQGAAITYLERRPSQNYALDVDALAAAVTPQTRLIVITNLHNPSGALTGAETLHQVADVARRVGAYVLVDEVYRDLAGAAAPCAAALSPDVFITISSATKAYGLGTVRAGWVIAPPELVPLLREKHVTYECSLSPYAQRLAALFFGEHHADYLAHADAVIAYNYPLAVIGLTRMERRGRIAGELAPYGCVTFPAVPGVSDTWTLAAWLRDAHKVVVAPGEFFRAPGHIRVCFGGDSTRLSEALSRLNDALREYQTLAV